MKWSSVTTQPTNAMLRQFATAWLVFLSGWGFFVWLARGHRATGTYLLVAGVVIGVAGLLKPNTIRWLYSTLMLLAFPIGWLVSTIVLLIIFYGIFTPVSFLFKLLGRDPLSRKTDRNRASFWVARKDSPEVSRYFRQY